MTYHVDLLLEDERRSASRVNVGLVLRLSVMISAAVIVFITVMLFVASQDMSVSVERANARLKQLEKPYAQLQGLRKKLVELRASSHQIEACRRSRLALGVELTQLQAGIPENIQLTALRITQNQLVGNQKTGAVRGYEMRLSGKVIGDHPQENVEKLRNYLQAAAYTGRVEAVNVPNNTFRKESLRNLTTGEVHTDWFFEMVCRFRPRSFE